jgi:dTMP kinase
MCVGAQGVLIAIEGIDGSGKTTQANLLADYLRGRGLTVLATKEPTRGPWGQKLRESKHAGRLSPSEELRYFIEDRRQHVVEEIAPALSRGEVVIVDRYYYSTVAYQGARGLDPAELLRKNQEFAPIPDLVVLLDVDPRVGIERIQKRGDQQDEFEKLEDLTNVRAVFGQLDEPHIFKIDGHLPPGTIHAAILTRLLSGPLAQRICSP